MNWGPISLDEVEMLKNNIGYYVPEELKYLIYKDLNKLVEIDVNKKDLNLKDKLMEILSD